MTSISSVDTSIYSGLIESTSTSSGRNASVVAKEPTFKSSDVENSVVDLSSYYSNIASMNLYSEMGDNVAKSAQDLDNAMVSALANGYSVQDACNVKMAEVAYKANCNVLSSTIELAV